MTDFNRKAHWENIYGSKSINEVSWYQPVPETSLDLLSDLNLSKDAKFIDVGGGDSFLVDHLLDLGYSDLTVLDISEKAIERAKVRLGEKAEKINWIVSDSATFVPTVQYDVWHDRAAFHFLTDKQEIEHYINAVKKGLRPSGKLIVGTFSEDGPTKCSGIEITQYSESTLTQKFEPHFGKINCLMVDHQTPFNTTQNFIFCSFKKSEGS